MSTKKHHSVTSQYKSTFPIVEILIVITILTALIMGIIVTTDPLGRLLVLAESSSNSPLAPKDMPLPPLKSARSSIPGGSPFFTAMNEFPQVIGGYIAPADSIPNDHPFYLEISIRDREAPVSKVVALIETPSPKEIPLVLIDGTEREGVWGGVWRYPGKYKMSVVSYDTKNNSTKVGIIQ